MKANFIALLGISFLAFATHAQSPAPLKLNAQSRAALEAKIKELQQVLKDDSAKLKEEMLSPNGSARPSTLKTIEIELEPEIQSVPKPEKPKLDRSTPKDQMPNPDWLKGVREVGNGGDAVVCFDKNKIKSVELLDFWEARNLLKWKIDLGTLPAGADERTLVLRAIDVLAKRHPITAFHYRSRLARFFEDTRIERGMKLNEIADEQINAIAASSPHDQGNANRRLKDNYVMIPTGCKIIQLAIRRDRTKVPDSKTFNINGDLWDRMPPLERAGIMLHEIVYEDMLLTDEYGVIPLEHPEPDSRHVRYVTALLANPDAKNWKDTEWLKEVWLNGWFIEDFEPMDLVELSLRVGGKKKIDSLDRDEPIKVGDRTLMALRGSVVDYYDVGTVKKLTLAKDTPIELESGRFVLMAGSEVLFTSSGDVLRGYLAQDSRFKVGGKNYVARGNYEPLHIRLPITPIEPTLFWPGEFPQSFFAPDLSMKTVSIADENGSLHSPMSLEMAIHCPRETPEDFCMELHRNGVSRKLIVNLALLRMGDVRLRASDGQIVNLKGQRASQIVLLEFNDKGELLKQESL